jgi:uncharacterized SAM-dependent methyltransferase
LDQTIKQPRKDSPSEKLLQGKNQEERDKFARSYKRAKSVTSEINRVLTRELDSVNKGMDSPKNFETPNWQYLNAWQSGYRHALRLAQDLTRQT